MKISKVTLCPGPYKKIGKLDVENDWLKKRLWLSFDNKRAAIELAHEEVSINAV